MDRTTSRIMELLDSMEYKESAAEAGDLAKRISLSNRFQVEAIFGEAEAFFSKMREERPEIYSVLAIREKEIVESAIRIKAGKSVVLD